MHTVFDVLMKAFSFLNFCYVAYVAKSGYDHYTSTARNRFNMFSLASSPRIDLLTNDQINKYIFVSDDEINDLFDKNENTLEIRHRVAFNNT